MKKTVKKRGRGAHFPEHCRPLPNTGWEKDVSDALFRSILGQSEKLIYSATMFSGALSASVFTKSIVLFLTVDKSLKMKLYGRDNY